MCFNKLCYSIAEAKIFQQLFTFRGLFALGLLGCILLLIGSNVVEHYFYVIPCQLCLLQRFVYYALTGLFLLGALHNPKSFGRYIYAGICFIFTCFGIVIAGRQIWIQHLHVPIDQIPECAPGLERLLSIYPFLDVIKMVFHGTSECFKVHFTVLGLPLSNWSFLSFIGFICLCLLIVVGHKKRWI